MTSHAYQTRTSPTQTRDSVASCNSFEIPRRLRLKCCGRSIMVLKFNRDKDRCLCGLLSSHTGVFLVSVAVIITDLVIYFLCLYPRWIEYNYALLDPDHLSFMNPRMIGVAISALGILSGLVLMIGNRCEVRITYVIFIVCTGLVIFYLYFAIFILLFRVFLLAQEKGDLHRRQHFVEAGIFVVTMFLNFYYAFVVARN
ncbi:hypothetical protein M3Y95_01107100 [Aphelenchoides besseyi]|nr:hypothetical protein M3Y95_01107100 [Aphelenchoides besseyi]